MDEQYFTQEELDELFNLAGLIANYDEITGKKITKIHRRKLLSAGALISEILEDYTKRFDYQPLQNLEMN